DAPRNNRHARLAAAAVAGTQSLRLLCAASRQTLAARPRHPAEHRRGPSGRPRALRGAGAALERLRSLDRFVGLFFENQRSCWNTCTEEVSSRDGRQIAMGFALSRLTD